MTRGLLGYETASKQEACLCEKMFESLSFVG